MTPCPPATPRKLAFAAFIVATVVLALLLFCACAAAAELKLATWNLEWLTLGNRDLPPDVRPKRPEDIELLRRYAAELDADVIAVQEVDGPAMAARVFPPRQILYPHE